MFSGATFLINNNSESLAELYVREGSLVLGDHFSLSTDVGLKTEYLHGTYNT